MIILSYPVKFPPGFHLITLLPQAKSMTTLSYPVKFPPGFHLIPLLPQWKIHCNKDFKGSECDEMETWRELYWVRKDYH
jgi:hypothetical protein